MNKGLRAIMAGVTTAIGPLGAHDVRPLFLSTAAACLGLIANPLVALAWTRPSVLDQLSVGALAGHLSRGILQVEWYLDADPLEVVSTDTLVSASQYYAPFTESADLSSDMNLAVQARGAERAELGHAAIVTELQSCLARLPERLRTESLDRTVEATGSAGLRGRIMVLDEYLRVRLVEQTIHHDDLLLSVRGLIAAPIDDAAYECAVTTLVGAAVARRGALAVLRALARRERDADAALRVL